MTQRFILSVLAKETLFLKGKLQAVAANEIKFFELKECATHAHSKIFLQLKIFKQTNKQFEMKKLIELLTTNTGNDPVTGRATGSFVFVKPDIKRQLTTVALKSSCNREFLLTNISCEVKKTGNHDGSGYVIVAWIHTDKPNTFITLALTTETWTTAAFKAFLGDSRQNVLEILSSNN